MINRLPFAEPVPGRSQRAKTAKQARDLATEISRIRPQAQTKSNGEEIEHCPADLSENAPGFAANFTKGLLHNGNGMVQAPVDYLDFVEAINSTDLTLFEKHVTSAADRSVSFACTVGGAAPKWRGWESPRAGHVYELQGPDAGSVGMAPAPRVNSSEFVAEIAEVYGLALLRDVPFEVIAEGGGTTICECPPKGGKGKGKGKGKPAKSECVEAKLTAAEVADLITSLPFYSGTDNRSSTPTRMTSGYNGFEQNRRDARLRFLGEGDALMADGLFRGSTHGAHQGPYISQFLLAGNTSRRGGVPGGSPSFPGEAASFDAEDGFIVYGTQIIDQRVVVHKQCLDHMVDWNHWLDVQNGANLGGASEFEAERRFISTPRDLATYVHYDALYQAYLNAALLLLGAGAGFSRGFPENSPSGRRTSFATFGGPHILSLVTEVATRCLKAVRRQKFNYHRRGRPELVAARIALAHAAQNGKLKAGTTLEAVLGAAAKSFAAAEDELPDALLEAIVAHNADQASKTRLVNCPPNSHPDAVTAGNWPGQNTLLPMAFPEGSPMHPAYGAGHATVAGGCVTMLKAFFEMFDDCRGEQERILDLDGNQTVWVPNPSDRTQLKEETTSPNLTIQGELDKLAANISIGRNMAGVHFYSDYYDSVRMGERVAIGILMEQIPSYNESVETMFTSFDGDLITITGEGMSCPALTICDRHGRSVSPRDWWLRHVPGEEIIEDLF